MANDGLNQFLDWGTGSSITTTAGKVTGGGGMRYESGAQHREGIGAQDEMVGGLVPLGGSFDFIVENEAILAYGLRSSFTTPSLTALTFAGGDRGDGRQQTGCQINTMTLRMRTEEAMTASIDFLSLTDAAYSTTAKAYDTDTPWEWFGAASTIASVSTWEVASWELTINNNLSHLANLDTFTTNQKRWPDSIHVGSQEISFTAEIRVPVFSTVIADIISDSLATNLSASLTALGGTAGTDTMTIALSNLTRISQPIPLFTANNVVTYSVAYEAQKDASNISISVVAA